MPADSHNHTKDEALLTPADGAPIAAPAKEESWLPLALDFGPLLIFFISFRYLGMIAGTAAFMVSIVVALIVSKLKLGRVSPMLWLSAVLVLFFGSLTIYFKNFGFIQHKPTIIYTFFAIMLLGGWLRGRPLLKYLLGAAYKGLNEQGWLKLSRNWGFFFVAMAIINEIAISILTDIQWISFKLWGITIVSMLFAVSNVPMLLRHGLDVGEGKAG
ncbi:MAG TPA: septation protein IspZ [Sphingobium sp.]